MSPTATAIIAILSVLVLLNIILTIGVVRRLRDHETRIGEMGAPPGLPKSPAPGTPIPEFDVVTTDGGRMSSSSLMQGTHYVGFFTTHCPPCRERLPQFVDLAAENEPGMFLVIVEGEEDEARALAASADGVAKVVLENETNRLSRLFKIDGFPTMLVVEDGVVMTNAGTIGQLTSVRQPS